MNILDIIFPKKCALCKEITSSNGSFLCKECERDLPVMNHICAVENLRIYGEKELSIYCALRYTGSVKKGIVSMKYGDRPQVAEFLGEKIFDILSRNQSFSFKFSDFDMAVPVPATKEKIRSRGYNQAFLIAESFARKAEIPVTDNALVKISNVKSQSLMDFAARQKSVSGIYREGDTENIRNKKILLLDDILTTGATVMECAKVLYKAGADLVVAVTASTGKKDIS